MTTQNKTNPDSTSNRVVDHETEPKAAAVECWKGGLNQLPEDAEYAETLREADIHDRSDRREIEEIIHNELPADNRGLAVEDAYHDLKEAFSNVW